MNIIDMLNAAWNAGYKSGVPPEDDALESAYTSINRQADIHRIFAQHTAADMVVEIVEDWQPIETAPHDKLILVYAPGAQDLPSITCTCMWHEDAGFCVDELREPTHWMPLPEPPT